MNAGPVIPLHVNFSHEDKAAKGLRSLREQAAPQEPVYFTAREMALSTPRLLIAGERGAGKTVLARSLAQETGALLVEADDADAFAAWLERMPKARAYIVDGLDRLGEDGPRLVADFLSRLSDEAVLLLGDIEVVRRWPLPAGFQMHALRPLSVEDRQAGLGDKATGAALSGPAGNPALFAIAQDVDAGVDSAERLIDAWAGADVQRVRGGFEAVARGTSRNRAVDDLLAAKHLSSLPADDVARLYLEAADRWTPAVRSLLRRAPDMAEGLGRRMLDAEGDAARRGVLLVAAALDDASPLRQAVADALLATIEEGRLAPFDRDAAARILSRRGDPRDLEALCEVPGGAFTMGSDTNPNSRPVHRVEVSAFRIGRYPVTNALYRRFVEATGRRWISPEATVPERANAPAADLTWRDATAYCAWLTGRWRQEGRIGKDEIVRLPSEPEWERAARGDQPDGGQAIVYPWGGGWDAQAANSEESGFNGPCAVGIFPAGRSPYGCDDMAGQVWEWTTTLWGDDMATPHFAYPYRDDGREDPEAGPSIRRVLRGGCFSSGRQKACCTYRGSLEPDGFWRGNGFRVAVAKAGAR